MSFLSSLSPPEILRQLRQGQESSTFERLSASRHVADLRLIFSVTVILMIAASILALMFCFDRRLTEFQSSQIGWTWARLIFSSMTDAGVIIGAFGTVGCGVLASTYQPGSARLGVVDLFACEIATLCRVAAVTDLVERYVDLFRTGPQLALPHQIDGDAPMNGGRFTSQESYFPVFERSVKDLQQLEADVVENVTAFYTYMKVTRDSLRKLAEIHPALAEGHADDWHQAICHVIYMQFLGLESGRKAIKQLVEYEPTQAEDIFTILLSELVAYAFLREQFRGDLRQRLLKAREEKYRQDVPDLYLKVKDQTGPKWERAKEVAAEVMKRHAEIFSADVPLPKRVTEFA